MDVVGRPLTPATESEEQNQKLSDVKASSLDSPPPKKKQISKESVAECG